ncbi:MAG: bifunctional phosphoglucose/phosphomannose isomerase [Nitrososphaerales archaeon]
MQRENPLDDVSISSLDSAGFCSLYDNWLEHCKNGWAIKVNVERIPQIRELFIAGMGGSGIAGEVLRDWLEPLISVPIRIVKDYNLPLHAKSGLLVAVSCSGNTQEILSLVKEGAERNLKIVGLSSGGALSNLAKRAGFPLIESKMISSPRTSFPYLFFPLVNLLEQIGIYDGRKEVEESFKQLKETLSEIHSKKPFETNYAKQLADWLKDGIPVIYGANWNRAVGLRFKNQLNENAKIHAYSETLPELCHNEIAAWDPSPKFPFRPILLRNDREPKEISSRFELLQALLEKKGVEMREINVSWKGPLPTALAQLLIVDYVSVYTALLRGIDPSSTETIESFKKNVGAN